MSEMSAGNSSGAQTMLVASRALSAARPALISLLITSGAELSNGVAHPISFCNVLFIGNFCAALLVGFWFGFGTIVTDLKSLTPRVRWGLFINGCLATLLSTLIFLGLQETTVTNAVLLGRLGPVLFAVAGALVLGKKIKKLEWAGFSLIAVGVVAIALHTSDFQANHGDVLILLSTLVFATSALINQLMIANAATLPVVVFSRNFLSSIVFFAIALRLFGPHHFADTFSGSLWIIMTIYSLIVIVFAQFLWYASIKHLDSRTIGRLTVLSPIFGVSYAFILNGEQPSAIQIGTLVVIILGVLIASLGSQKSKNLSMDTMAQDTESVASAP
ncbi:MAG: DMT family transporter [Cyanobacteria bacterium P01_F01_bin.53]